MRAVSASPELFLCIAKTDWRQNIINKLPIVNSSVTYREVPDHQNDSSP